MRNAGERGWWALAGAACVAMLGCSAYAPEEPRALTTAKLLKAHASTTMPASSTDDFVQAVGGTPIDIDAWAGYVAGTVPDALFEMHLSGLKKEKPVAGLSLAFVESSGPGKGDLPTRLAAVPRLEVRFHDGSGIVSTHVFPADGSQGTSTAAHRDAPATAALLARAFNDAETLLRSPRASAGGGDKAAACMASFLGAVSAAARCVDDAANTQDCTVVRKTAVLTAASCDGPTTANVLADPGGTGTAAATTKTRSLPLLGGASSLLPFFPLTDSSTAPSFANLLFGGLGLGGMIGGPLFDDPVYGGGALFDGDPYPAFPGDGPFNDGAFADDTFVPASFGNQFMNVDDFGGGVVADPIFD